MSSTAFLYHPIYLNHDTGPHHPERPSRLQSILRKLQKTGLIDRLNAIEPQPASTKYIELVHPREHISRIKEACAKGGGSLDPDTVVSADSYEAALFAAGAVLTGIDYIIRGNVSNAFCLIRPPGHHARPSQAMGFCLFNNVAIGARYLQKIHGLKRILIIDWDVHHGNGTEEVFCEDPEVFYISLHQYPHYPGTGGGDYIGKGRGKGFTLNIPMNAGSGDLEYINVFKDTIMPKIDNYKPEFILISAGFDGHRDDPLSSTTLTESGYYEMTALLKKAANLYADDRLISVLEGGYNLTSLASSAISHIESLLSHC